MKNRVLKKTFLCFFTIFFVAFYCTSFSLATSTNIYGELDDKTLQKNMDLNDQDGGATYSAYILNDNVDVSASNPFLNSALVGASTEAKYSLKDVIPENMIVRNQEEQNICWAFAATGSLESNLALKDYRNKANAVKYDFSERHMDYCNVREFNNGKINEYGYNRKPGAAGTYNMALSYMRSGFGMINESEMPFKNNVDTINIEEIENKPISAVVTDSKTIMTNNVGVNTNRAPIKAAIKEYGGLFTLIYGASLDSEFCNIENGAIFCNDTSKKVNHAVMIIGWDDNYPLENFNEKNRPSHNGAWIIKNSWGGNKIFTYNDAVDFIKQQCFSVLSDSEKKNLDNNYKKVTENMIVERLKRNEQFSDCKTTKDYIIKCMEIVGFKYNSNDNNFVYKIGDDGIMYVSYEDIFVNTEIEAIINARQQLKDEKRYFYDKHGCVSSVKYYGTNTYSIGNKYKRNNMNTEYINEISLYLDGDSNVKIFVNSKDDNFNNATQVKLEEGLEAESEGGYHTFRLATPIELNNDKFCVYAKVTGLENSNNVSVPLEIKLDSTLYNGITQTKENQSFISTGNYISWKDLNSLTLSNTTIAAQNTLMAITSSQKNENEKEEEEKDNNDVKEENAVDENEINANQIEEVNTIEENKTSTNKIDEVNTIEENETNTNKIEEENTIDENNTKDSRPKNSDLSSIKLSTSDINRYTFTNGNEEYTTIKVNVSNIKKLTKNKSEYYYQLSIDKDGMSNKNFIKIKNAKLNNDTLTFEINSKDIENFDEIYSNDKIYLTLKEVATSDSGATSEAISNKIELVNNEGKVNYYIDGKKKEELNTDVSKVTPLEEKDTTVANKDIPNTGVRTILVSILIICVIGIIAFTRYLKLKIK